MKLLLKCHNNERHDEIKSKINSINVYCLSFHKLISIIYMCLCVCVCVFNFIWFVLMDQNA